MYLTGNILMEIRPPEQGILSRTLHNADSLKVVIFGFSAGHELSAHSAPWPASIQILEGEAEVMLDGRAHSLGAGAFVSMPPGLSHGILAKTPLVMLLTIWKGTK